jgi:hypothetical protein
MAAMNKAGALYQYGQYSQYGVQDRQTEFGSSTDDTGTADKIVTVTTDTTDTTARITSVTYSDEAIAELIYMIEEEKLAGDVYEYFYDLYGLPIFENIAESEDRHFEALIKQAEKLGIDVDDFVFAEAGSFENEELQELYDSLIEMGSESLTAALEVGVIIEEKDMIDIAAAIDNVEGTQLASVYENLLEGSVYHLDAFEALLG